MTATAPPRLRPGQTIGVCAPAGPVKPGAQERLKRGLDRLSTFAIRLAPTLTTPRAAVDARGEPIPSYLSASDDQRADELIAMLRDPDIRAIVLARGGYGIARILDRLDPDDLRRDPKPIVGFSDGTALLSWAHAAGVRGIHGPMAVQLGDLPASDAERLVAMLVDPAPPRPWALASPGGKAGTSTVAAQHLGTAGDGMLGIEDGRSPGRGRGGDRGAYRGPLIAANLTLASMLVGTRWPLPLAGAIALFEEVGERPYEIDRYFTQLMATGALRDVTAVAIGDFTRCDDPNPPTGEPDPPDAALRTICERLATARKPFALGVPVGHGDRNEAVPFGAPAELDLDRGVLAILEGAVA